MDLITVLLHLFTDLILYGKKAAFRLASLSKGMQLLNVDTHKNKSLNLCDNP